MARQLDLQMLYLQSLFNVHLAKEERVCLLLVEQVVTSEDQHALLAALHEKEYTQLNADYFRKAVQAK